jgi:demethylmenaquinone methyltransferase/2-methoxy-6-polyprenyl-1,4-benzoquinol methylase
MLQELSPLTILDVATGTGDFAIEALRIAPEQVTGTDISEAMLEIGVRKVKRRELSDRIRFVPGDAENLPFEDATFDAVISGFGVRNFEDPEKGIGEMIRVMRSGGQVVILEFSKPRNAFFSLLYRFYFSRVLPAIGRMVSKDKSAYRYLPESVREFPDGEAFLALLKRAGFEKCRFTSLTFGIAAIYTGFKP